MRHVLKLSLPAIAASLLIAACGSSSSSSTTSSAAGTQPTAQTSGSPSSVVLVKSASSSLGTILIDGQGMTLYHLSGEQNGKFICTSSACVGVWHPLIAPSSGTPGGEVGSLGTVKRPDGTVQVTYKGTPLYTFTGDQQSGETKGQGIKDVGTWSVVTTSSSSTPATSPSSSSTTATSTSSTPATPAPSTGSSSESSSGGGYAY
jgi:predicted lipoprotein with Yx(FWY)xxD motif